MATLSKINDKDYGKIEVLFCGNHTYNREQIKNALFAFKKENNGGSAIDRIECYTKGDKQTAYFFSNAIAVHASSI